MTGTSSRSVRRTPSTCKCRPWAQPRRSISTTPTGPALTYSTGGPLTNPVLSQALAAGTYYVRVGGGDTSYTLSTWTGAPTVGTFGAADTGGNTTGAATSLGALGATAVTQ